jgi:hypothetical protein
MKMLIERLPDDIREALACRLEASELVDFLQVTTDEIIELLEDRILANLQEVKELADLETEENYD